MSSPAFQAAREAHLRSIGRKDLITTPESKPALKNGGIHDPAWVERELIRLDAEEGRAGGIAS